MEDNVFEIVSGTVIISDPDFDESYGQVKLGNVRKGRWIAEVQKENDRIAKFGCRAIDSDNSVGYYPTGGMVGVDSGQAGIFDIKSYRDNEVCAGIPLDGEPLTDRGEFYNLCCDITLSKEMFGVVPGGAVSSTGYGDGNYEIHVAKQFDEVVGILLVFIDENDGDEEDYYDQGEELNIYDDDESYDEDGNLIW